MGGVSEPIRVGPDGEDLSDHEASFGMLDLARNPDHLGATGIKGIARNVPQDQTIGYCLSTDA